MRIQFFSDIHLEFGPCELPLAGADVLIAAGDVSTETTGLEWLMQADCPVIYIAGNHEYYGGDVVYTLNELRVQAKTLGIFFLENDSVVIDGVRFLGTTLWTDFNQADENIMSYAADAMNDYCYINKAGKLLTPKDILDIHQESKNWLTTELQKPFDGKTIVITHHAPTLASWHQEPDAGYLYSYCNDLETLMEQNDIELWIHGHTHAVFDYTVNNVRVLCNPRGYYGYGEVNEFMPDKIVEI